MKFDASNISDAKRAQWAEVERLCALDATPVGEPAMHNGKRMIWFFGGEIYVDGYVFADCYGMPVDSAQHDIVQCVEKLLGKVRVEFDAELPNV